MPSRKVIKEFLGQKRIALVGVSRNSQQFANMVYRKFKEKGYEVVPVNATADQVEGVPCYHSVREIPGPVDAVLAILPESKEAAVVRDCQEAGIKRVWLRTGSKAAVAQGREAGLAVIDGACPFMFLGGGLHTVHRWFTKFEE